MSISRRVVAHWQRSEISWHASVHMHGTLRIIGVVWKPVQPRRVGSDNLVSGSIQVTTRYQGNSRPQKIV